MFYFSAATEDQEGRGLERRRWGSSGYVMKSHFGARDQAARSHTGCIPILFHLKTNKLCIKVKLESIGSNILSSVRHQFLFLSGRPLSYQPAENLTCCPKVMDLRSRFVFRVVLMQSVLSRAHLQFFLPSARFLFCHLLGSLASS